jgi:hypothetical protein
MSTSLQASIMRLEYDPDVELSLRTWNSYWRAMILLSFMPNVTLKDELALPQTKPGLYSADFHAWLLAGTLHNA